MLTDSVVDFLLPFHAYRFSAGGLAAQWPHARLIDLKFCMHAEGVNAHKTADLEF